MGTLKSSSETESAGQEGFCSQAKSITFTDRIIPFLSGTAVKLLFIVHLSCSPPLNDGLTAARLSGETGTFGIDAEGLDAGSEHRPTARRAAGTITSSKKPFSGSLKKPPNRFSPHPRSWESQRCHPSRSEFTVCRSSAAAFRGLVKAGTWKNDIKPLQDCHLICHGTRSYTYLA